MNLNKKRGNKAIAMLLVFGTLVSHAVVYAREAYVWPNPQSHADLTFTKEVNDAIENLEANPTGLSFEFTFTDKSISSMGFEKYWLNAKNPGTAERELEGSNEIVKIDFSKLDHTFISCIAEHVEGSENATRAYGAQGALMG